MYVPVATRPVVKVRPVTWMRCGPEDVAVKLSVEREVAPVVEHASSFDVRMPHDGLHSRSSVSKVAVAPDDTAGHVVNW